jgi:hypothetical protein
LAVVAVGAKVKELAEAIVAGGPTPIVYDTDGTPKEVLAEDKIIEHYPLRLSATGIKIVPVKNMFEK